MTTRPNGPSAPPLSPLPAKASETGAFVLGPPCAARMRRVETVVYARRTAHGARERRKRSDQSIGFVPMQRSGTLSARLTATCSRALHRITGIAALARRALSPFGQAKLIGNQQPIKRSRRRVCLHLLVQPLDAKVESFEFQQPCRQG